MKVSREQAEQNRERVLQVAAKLFRERGFDGIGVADLMKSAGMTHGGFYGQFGSKEDLMAEACSRVFDEGGERWRRVVGEAAARGEDGLAALARTYLSTEHRDEPGDGCPVSALGAEAARQGPALRAAFTAGVRGALDFIGALVGGRKTRRRERAIVAYAAMIGAQVLARAVDDEALSAEILHAVAADLAGDAGAVPAAPAG
jgi:TetR/AcrR family transcriptional repressor of nem operon